MHYEPKSTPYKHQQQAFGHCQDACRYALFMEQRTGKTKVVIDKAAYGFELNQADRTTGINALLIIAMPGRVHRNWVVKEIPAHLPDRIPRLAVVWESGKANTKRFQAELANLLSFKGLSILAINGEAILTATYKTFIQQFLKARRVFVAADESTLLMKTPGTARTKAMHWLGKQHSVIWKMILDGTPIGEGPLDLYSQMAFLDHRILGFTSFYAFKHRYAEWKKETNWKHNIQYEAFVKYQNLDELTQKLAPYSFRILRKDCWDVLPKVYQTHSFQLSPEQRRVYDAIASEYETEMPCGATLTAHSVLTRYIRLQQITSNYWPSERTALIHPLCKGEGCEHCQDLGVVMAKTARRTIDQSINPRLKALEEVLALNQVPGIVWARFYEDLDAIALTASALGRTVVKYDGRNFAKEKDASEDAFQTSKADLLVGHPKAGGRGLRLDKAHWIAYYSNDWPLLSRLQSEDRAEAQGRTIGTGIIDIVAENTVDETIADALRSKKTVVDFVMNERGGSWL